jgi:uncharacterized protein YjbI with pentapeptide repeats
MNIVKSLHSSLLHKCFSYQEKHYFTVSVLWGFNLTTGEPVLEQEMWESIGDMLGKSELFDAGMPKPNAELLVQGSCFVANGEAVNANRVSVLLGSISKELLVFGDRHWIKGMGIGWGVSDPELFTEMPVSYGNAFGGKEHAPNPVGKGIDAIDLNGEPTVPLPNIEYANQLIGSPKDKPQPASLNRTDIMCEQRLSNAGTYDQKYIETRMPGFPDDMNYDYFNDAASDQWVEGYFNGDEQYEIRNMHPQHSIIKGQIPGVTGRVFVNHQVNDVVEFKEIPTQLDTVWFFPNAELGVMIHRGTLEVSEDDGADIKQLLVANENIKDTPREPTHYQNELALRTDPTESFKYLLYTAPLIPEGTKCGFKVIQDKADFSMELLGKENMENFAEVKKLEAEAAMNQQLEDAKKQLVDVGENTKHIDDMVKQLADAKDNPAPLSPEMQKIADIMEKVLPGMMADPKNIDLTKLNLKAMDELKEHMEKMQVKKKAEAKQQLTDQIDKLKEMGAGSESEDQIAQLENVVTEMDLPPILPRIDVEAIIGQLKSQQTEMDKQLLQMQSMGLPEEQLLKMKNSFNVEAIEQQTREGLEKACDGYRMGAHFIETGRSPHAGCEGNIREQLIKAYQSRGKTSQGDYAYVDLSGLDLSGISLSGSYLEYADLTNTNLTNANLSKAILSHAIVCNTNFTNANLCEANLGAIDFDGAEFVNADLTGATLSKSNISKTTFKQCKMAEKMDMFLETKFDHASFIECDLNKNVFIDADISGCDFTGSNLSESSFVNPIMTHAIFSRANLSGTNFVTAVADGSRFDHATLKNVRFVGESSLENADFRGADASEANLRDCNLQKAKFAESTLLKSDFGGANLKHADFEKANAVGAQFNKADLTFATLQRANLMEGSMYKSILSSTQFTQSNLYGVNFLGCTIGETDFTGAHVEQTIFKDWKP